MVQMFLLMLLQTAMLAFSQVALKLAMEGMHWEWSWSFIWHNVILNGWLMLAVTLMIGANLFWLWMLHKYPLSQVYPLTSLGLSQTRNTLLKPRPNFPVVLPASTLKAYLDEYCSQQQSH